MWLWGGEGQCNLSTERRYITTALPCTALHCAAQHGTSKHKKLRKLGWMLQGKAIHLSIHPIRIGGPSPCPGAVSSMGPISPLQATHHGLHPSAGLPTVPWSVLLSTLVSKQSPTQLPCESVKGGPRAWGSARRNRLACSAACVHGGGEGGPREGRCSERTWLHLSCRAFLSIIHLSRFDFPHRHLLLHMAPC